MAKPSQFSSSNFSGAVGGAGQAVVHLHAVCGQGLIFWARQRFALGTELQVRLRSEGLPKGLRIGSSTSTLGGWIMLRGFVVQCIPKRRQDGSCGFEVSFLVARETGTAAQLSPVDDSRLFFGHAWLGGRRLGLN